MPDLIKFNTHLYLIGISMYNYLYRLTGIDVLNEETMKYYKNYVKALNEYLVSESKLEIYRSLVLHKTKRKNNYDSK